MRIRLRLRGRHFAQEDGLADGDGEAASTVWYVGDAEVVVGVVLGVAVEIIGVIVPVILVIVTTSVEELPTALSAILSVVIVGIIVSTALVVVDASESDLTARLGASLMPTQ